MKFPSCVPNTLGGADKSLQDDLCTITARNGRLGDARRILCKDFWSGEVYGGWVDLVSGDYAVSLFMTFSKP